MINHKPLILSQLRSKFSKLNKSLCLVKKSNRLPYEQYSTTTANSPLIRLSVTAPIKYNKFKWFPK